MYQYELQQASCWSGKRSHDSEEEKQDRWVPSKGVGVTLNQIMQGPKGQNTFIKIQMGDAVVYTFPKEEYDIHPDTTKANTRCVHMNHTRT